MAIPYSPPLLTQTYVHGYLTLTVCTMGIFGNGLSLMVLSQPHMRTPLNLLLATLAVVDLVLLSTAGVETTHRYLVHNDLDPCDSQAWAVYFLVSFITWTSLTTVNVWLSVAVAVIRYFAVSSRRLTVGVFSGKMAAVTVLMTVVCSALYNLPFILSFRYVCL